MVLHKIYCGTVQYALLFASHGVCNFVLFYLIKRLAFHSQRTVVGYMKHFSGLAVQLKGFSSFE